VGTYFIELGQLDELERLPGQFVELDGARAGESGRLGHGRAEQEEGGAVADSRGPRAVLAGRQVGLGEVAVGSAAVLDEQLLELELAAAAVHRALVHLVLELVEALLARVRELEGVVLLPVGPAVCAEAGLEVDVAAAGGVGGS